MSVAMLIAEIGRTLDALPSWVYTGEDHLPRGRLLRKSLQDTGGQASQTSPTQNHRLGCGDSEGPSSQTGRSVTRSFAEHEGVRL